ncbi:MAG TPA: hypothetical protein ENN06_03215 [Desulfobacteraceae bacterium]|nr:hypothetical protein [Desulfobacteraceae bacterium]
MSSSVAQFLQDLGMSQAASQTLTWGIIAAAVVLIAVPATWLVRNIVVRAINIDMSSIRFITDDQLDSLSKIQLLGDYIRQKQKEIEEDNKRRSVDTSVIINGRRQTNIGIFRAYVAAYLRQHPKINKEMTFLVRHLQPGE